MLSIIAQQRIEGGEFEDSDYPQRGGGTVSWVPSTTQLESMGWGKYRRGTACCGKLIFRIDSHQVKPIFLVFHSLILSGHLDKKKYSHKTTFHERYIFIKGFFLKIDVID